MTPDSKLLSIALQAVEAAEKILDKYYQADLRSQLKVDQSPVTIADQEAEQVIKHTISSVFPEHAFLGEESSWGDAVQSSKQADYLWIIDPIDCTKHYLRQIPLFATELALMKKGEVILGVSNAPKLHELLYAEKGKGAFLNDRALQVSKIAKLDRAYLSYGGVGYFQNRDLLDNFLKLERDTQGHRGIGDFWSYHLLAQGKIDIMVEAETKIWDIAAVSIIIEEAGGKVTNLRGDPVNCQTNSLVATNGILHQKVLKCLN